MQDPISCMSGGRRAPRRSARGMTLIELVIVIVIIGILAAVAVPSYSAYVIRSHRAEGKAALLALATAQEKFYLQCNTYATQMGAAHSCATSTLPFAGTTENGWYTLAIVNADNTAFTLSATAAGTQARDTDCQQFTVNDRGVRTAAASGGAANTDECWN